ATTCSRWKDDPSDKWTNEMPAFESRRVRTQPWTVAGAPGGACPPRISRTLKLLCSMERGYSGGFACPASSDGNAHKAAVPKANARTRSVIPVLRYRTAKAPEAI